MPKQPSRRLPLLMIAATVTAASAFAGIVTDPIHLTLSSTQTLSDSYVVYGYTGQPFLSPNPVAVSIGTVSAGSVSGSGLLTIDDTRPYFWTIVGIYNVSNNLVTVGFRDSVASSLIAASAPFALTFPTGLPNAFSGTEAAFATALENGDNATIASIWFNLQTSLGGLGTEGAPLNNGGGLLNGSLTLVNFSTAALDGTASISTVVPEPSALCLETAAMLGLLMLGRSRKHHTVRGR